jgi:hypothetical protein
MRHVGHPNAVQSNIGRQGIGRHSGRFHLSFGVQAAEIAKQRHAATSGLSRTRSPTTLFER